MENAVFDPKTFLAKVGVGKTILQFHKDQNVFAQGDIADSVFYIQNGKVKVTVRSELGKEAVVGLHRQFSAFHCKILRPESIYHIRVIWS